MIQSRFTHALRGLSDAVLGDPAIQLHAVIAVVVIFMGIVACLSPGGWALLLLTIGSVLAAELKNSALERLADRLHPGEDREIQRAKDLSASAVLVVAMVSALVGLLLFVSPILSGSAGSCLF